MSGTQRTGAGPEPDVARTVLPGGLRVITESLPAVRSAAFGIWAGVGSRRLPAKTESFREPPRTAIRSRSVSLLAMLM